MKDAATRCRPYPAHGTQFHSLAQLARALDIDLSRVKFQPMPKPKAEPHYKLTREQVEEAAAAIAEGASVSRTAEAMGVNRNTLTLALKRYEMV